MLECSRELLGNKPCTEHLRTHRLNIVEKAAHSTEVVLLGSADLNRGGDAQSQRQGIQWTAQRTAKLVNKTRRQCQSTLSKLRNLKKSEELCTLHRIQFRATRISKLEHLGTYHFTCNSMPTRHAILNNIHMRLSIDH